MTTGPSEGTITTRRASTRQTLDHGPSRIAWVYRNQHDVPLCIGWLYAYPDGTGRSGVVHRLLTFRHLMPGRYDLQFARYGRRWPVTIKPDEETDEPNMMLVEGRVPL